MTDNEKPTKDPEVPDLPDPDKGIDAEGPAHLLCGDRHPVGTICPRDRRDSDEASDPSDDPGTVDDMNRQIAAEPVKDTLETLFEGPPLVPGKPRARNCTRKCWVARGKKCACPCAGKNHGSAKALESFPKPPDLPAEPSPEFPPHIAPGHEETLKEMFEKLDAENKIPPAKRNRVLDWVRRHAKGR